MKTLAVVLALLCGVASAECRQDRRDRRINRLRDDCGSSGIPDDPGQFVFAPTNGGGMGTACACTTPTGSRGETMTFSRASTGSCMKGNETSCIANGDLVVCTSGQPRVMPGGDGTGVLGLGVWAARTNTLLRSDAFENAAWLTVNVGIAAPTVTANHAVGPDGTTTADRLQIAAAGAGTASYIYQSACPTGAARAQSIYVRGTSGSGTVLMAGGSAFGAGAGGGGYVQCAYVSTSWTRCIFSNTVTTSANPYLIGTSPLEGTVTTSAIDVLIWGAQCETGVDPSPMIRTEGTTAARVAEVVSFPWSQSDDTSGSMAATIVSPFVDLGSLGEHALLAEQVAGTYDRLLLLNTSTDQLIGYGLNATRNASTLTANTEIRSSYWWTPATSAIEWGGASSAGSAFPSGNVSTIQLGSYNASTAPLNGVIKKVCADSSSTVCR
ncbi:MAG: hypothetical protein NTV51_04020 [Verrucomicrobia bacterium]|nr:hypothetical protein [Verrucomicrobiota bacterium]